MHPVRWVMHRALQEPFADWWTPLLLGGTVWITVREGTVMWGPFFCTIHLGEATLGRFFSSMPKPASRGLSKPSTLKQESHFRSPETTVQTLDRFTLHICCSQSPVLVSWRIITSATSFCFVNHSFSFFASPVSVFSINVSFGSANLFPTSTVVPFALSASQLLSSRVVTHPALSSQSSFFSLSTLPDLLYLTPLPLAIISDTSPSSAHSFHPFFSLALSVFLISAPFIPANRFSILHRFFMRSLSIPTFVVPNRHPCCIVIPVASHSFPINFLIFIISHSSHLSSYLTYVFWTK